MSTEWEFISFSINNFQKFPNRGGRVDAMAILDAPLLITLVTKRE